MLGSHHWIRESMAMPTIVFEEKISIPAEVTDVESFRRWALSPRFPDRGRFSFLAGEVWFDMSPEELLTHNRVTGELAAVLTTLLKARPMGYFFHDRALVTCPSAELSTEPDGCFVSFESLKSGRVRLVEGNEGYVEMEGAPDMVLEVVSPSSVRKDTVTLRELYGRAGVDEYWLVDARGTKPKFDILRPRGGRLAAAPSRRGWLASAIFGRSFRLVRRIDEMGHPSYLLDCR